MKIAPQSTENMFDYDYGNEKMWNRRGKENKVWGNIKHDVNKIIIIEKMIANKQTKIKIINLGMKKNK